VLNNARIFLRVTAPIPQPELHFWNTNWTDSIAPVYLRRAIQYPATVLCLAFAALSVIHRRTLVVLFFTGTLLLAGFSIIHGQTNMRHQGQWFILLLLCYWIDRTHEDVDVRDFGGWQRMIRRFFPALIFAVQPVALIIPLVLLFSVPFSATAGLVKQVQDARLDSSAWSAYPESFLPPVSLASGRAVYCPEKDRFERFLNLVNSVEPTPEMVAHRLAAQSGGQRDVPHSFTSRTLHGVLHALGCFEASQEYHCEAIGHEAERNRWRRGEYCLIASKSPVIAFVS